MNKTDILDACLKTIEREGATINDCVARYPQVEGLREMLIAAHETRGMGRPIMSMAARTMLEQRLIATMEASPQRSRRISRLWSRIPVTLAATVLLVLIVTAGVVRLSSTAVPGDPLYGLKRTSEQVSLAFASAPERPVVLAQIAEARLGELATLAGRKSSVRTALADAISSLNAAAAAQPDPAVRAAIYAQGIQTIAQLAAAGLPAPSLLAALEGIATPTVTVTPVIIATNTETLTVTPTLTATRTVTQSATQTVTRTATNRPATTLLPPPTRLATRAPIIPTQIPPTVQPTPVPASAPSGNNGGGSQPTPDNHGSDSSGDSHNGDGSGSSQPTPDNHGSDSSGDSHNGNSSGDSQPSSGNQGSSGDSSGGSHGGNDH